LNYKQHPPTNIRTIRRGDPKFILKSGLVYVPRAAFQINPECPEDYREVIIRAISMGWLEPVANVYGKELTMDALRNYELI